VNSMTTLTTAALESASVRTRMPYAGLAALQAQSAPKSAVHGTTVSAAGSTTFAVRVNGTDGIDVPGSPPREAPV
jgi:hypothetical protein